jgi:hypothetical protein
MARKSGKIRFNSKSRRENSHDDKRREIDRREQSDRREIERFGYKVMSRRSGGDRRDDQSID